MTGSVVYQLIKPLRDDFPRLLATHPRNKSIDFLGLAEYAETGANPDLATTDIFIKMREDVHAVWLSGILAPAVSSRLRAVLEPLIAPDIEFRQIQVNGSPFWFLAVTTVLEALDLDRSKIRYHGTGGWDALEQPVWRADRIPDPSMFRIPQQKTVWTTSAVERACADSQLIGLDFLARGEVV